MQVMGDLRPEAHSYYQLAMETLVGGVQDCGFCRGILCMCVWGGGGAWTWRKLRDLLQCSHLFG